MKKISLVSLFALCLLMFFSCAGAPAKTSGAKGPTYTSNKVGVYERFDYELWSERASDPVSMTLTGGGTFECEWDNALNILFRTGKKLGSTKTHGEYGDIKMEYSGEYNITSGSVSYFCVYGWVQNPLAEFYIIESHGSYSPGKNKKGEFTVDGSVYDVYEEERVNKHSIEGVKTFKQYFSIRRDKRTEGTISLSEHFKKWEELGLPMGTMYEIAFCVEGYESSGNAKITKQILTVGDITYGIPQEETSDASELTLAAPLKGNGSGANPYAGKFTDESWAKIQSGEYTFLLVHGTPIGAANEYWGAGAVGLPNPVWDGQAWSGENLRAMSVNELVCADLTVNNIFVTNMKPTKFELR